MDNFAQNMKEIRREVMAQKELKEKAIMNFAVKSQSKTVTLTMNRNGYVTGLNVMSDKYAEIIATSTDGKNMIGTCTLRSSDDRSLDLRRLITDQGQLGWSLIIIDGNDSDWQTVPGGGSVSVTYTIDIRTSSNCNVTINYKDNPYAP